MSQPIVAREVVAEQLSVPARVLIRYEARGLVHAVRSGEVEGYEPAEIRRIWSIVSYQRDLGVNLAGVEAILKLRDHMAQVHRRLDEVAARLREALDDQGGSDADAT
jgi:MerR family transcriptional regulator/heat shock protein HspR